jgi:hypothetical protein
MYMGLLKERCIHLRKCVGTGSYNNTCISRFVCSVYSLSGPFSLLRSPDLTLMEKEASRSMIKEESSKIG